MAVAEVVIDNHVVPGLDQLRSHNAADISGASAYKDFHVAPYGLLTLNGMVATGANFSQIAKRGENCSRSTGATSDKEMGEIGPVPKGCGANALILRCRPRLGITKVFVLRLV
jgi:hypothetical protein